MPDQQSYKEWFLHLLKDEVESSKRYFTYDETEQMWNNVCIKQPQYLLIIPIRSNFPI